MMKSLLLCLFLPLVTLSQSEASEAIIYWRFVEAIDVYSMPNGAVLTSLQNDHDNENYLSLAILAETKDFFFANISYGVSGKSYEGWIKKREYIGAFSRNEKEVQNLILFSKPSSGDTKQIHLTDWQSEFITIEKCKDNWRFVSLRYKGEIVTGWIEAHKLCANNYSRCS